MAAPAPIVSPYQQRQQSEASTALIRRLQQKCYGFDVTNAEYRRLHKATKLRLERLDGLCVQVVTKINMIHNIQISILNLFHVIATEIKGLFDIGDQLYTLIPDESGKPLFKDYICDFFEATRVFAGKSELGFKDSAKRGYSSIIEWKKVSNHKECIVKLFETTPVSLPDDQYELVRSATINITHYKNAGLWCERVLESVRNRYQQLRNSPSLMVLEFLYNPNNRNTLEGCIKTRRDTFPFHTVRKIETVSEEEQQQMVQAMAEDERQQNILAKEKSRQKVAEEIVNLKKQIQDKDKMLEEKDQSLDEMDQLSEYKDELLKQMEQLLEAKDQVLEEKDQVLEEKDRLLVETNQIITDLNIRCENWAKLYFKLLAESQRTNLENNYEDENEQSSLEQDEHDLTPLSPYPDSDDATDNYTDDGDDEIATDEENEFDSDEESESDEDEENEFDQDDHNVGSVPQSPWFNDSINRGTVRQ